MSIKNYLRTHVTSSVFIFIIISFVVALILLIVVPGEHHIIKSITTAAGVAGLVGLFGDFLISFHERRERRANNRICYLSNDSTFSARIFNGVREGAQSSNFVLDRHYLDVNTGTTIEKFFKDFAYSYRGVIIRKKQFKEEEACIMKEYLKDHFIVFVDTELDDKSSAILKDSVVHYCIVNSDLTLGGEYIRDAIESLLDSYPENYQLAITLGPKEDPNIQKRCVVIKDLCVNKNCVVVNMDTLKLNSASFIKKLAENIDATIANCNTLSSTKKGTAVIIFCGNDHCAFELMRLLSLRHPEDKPENKKVVDYIRSVCGENYEGLYILGYDGLRDEDSKELKLTAFNNEYKYFTVDAHPEDQGKKACACVANMIQDPGKPIDAGSIKPDIAVSKLWQASVFDMDGTIANTEEYHLRAYQRLFADKFQITINSDEFIQGYMGHREEDIHQLIQKRYKIDYDIETITNERLSLFLEEIKGVQPFDKVVQEIKAVKGERYILSSQRGHVIEQLLKQWGLYELFRNRIIACPDRGITKQMAISNPVRFFGCPAQSVVLYEDSIQAIQMAHEIGINTVGVLNPFNRVIYKDRMTGADRIIET